MCDNQYSDEFLTFLDIIQKFSVEACQSSDVLTQQKWQSLQVIGLKILQKSELPIFNFGKEIPYHHLIRIFVNELGLIQVD
ncbi:hypothetical protein [Acinetobacter sp. c3-l95]